MTDTTSSPPEIIVSAVPPHLIDMVWPGVERILGPHLSHISGDRYEMSDIYREVSKSEQGLWCVFAPALIAVATTRVIDYPRKRALSCQFCAGTRMDEWIGPMQEKFEAFARDCGCQLLEMTGRRGWGMYLKRHNWKETEWSIFEHR